MSPHEKPPPLKTSTKPSLLKKEKKPGVVCWGETPRQDTVSGLPLFRGAKPDMGHALRFRLRRFKTRDLGFILAGFAVLVVAPLVELLLSSQEEATQLSQGFDRKGIEFSGLGSLFENGVFGIAPGGLIGGADVVSPLSGRDPTDLILGFKVEQEAPKASPVSESEPEPPKRGGWREAVSAARRGATHAARRARPPRPSARLASRLSGFSTQSSGSSSSGLALAAPASRGLLSRVYAEDHMKPVKTLPEYRGLDRGSGSGAPYLDPKKVISSVSNSGGSASGGAMKTDQGAGGTSSGGISGAGPDANKQSNVGVQDNKNIQVTEKKESLTQMAKKMNMEQGIKLKWDKKRYDQIERKKMAEQTMMQTASQAFLKILDKLLEGGGKGEDSGGGGGSNSSGGGSSPGGGGGAPEGQQVKTPEGDMGSTRTGEQNFVRSDGWTYDNQGQLMLPVFGKEGEFKAAPNGFKKEDYTPGQTYTDEKGEKVLDEKGETAQPKTESKDGGTPQGDPGGQQ
ncbi:MAG: hypothetical protein WC728_06625 [Elusimicrobiota bacterium]